MRTILRKRKLLAVSLGERAIVVAEAGPPGDAAPVLPAIEFPFPPELTLDTPELLGKALADFLQAKGITARRAVFGVPSKWLIFRPHTIPPADAETAAAMLWIHASEHVAPELGKMVFDFHGNPSPDSPAEGLLAGLQQKRMDNLQALARAAGLQLISVTPSIFALESVTAANLADSSLLWLRPDGAELISAGEYPRHIAQKGRILQEMRRLSATGGNGEKKLALWNENGTDETFLAELNQEAVVTPATPAWLDLPQNQTAHLSTAALRSRLFRGRPLSVDFLQSKVAPPDDSKPIRIALWVSITAAAIILIAVMAIADLTALHSRITDTDDQLQSLQPALTTAKPFVAGGKVVETFRPCPPKYLACLCDLTAAAIKDPQTTFNLFDLKSDMIGQVSGKSPAEQNVLNLVDQLRASGHFSDLKCNLSAAGSRAAGAGVTFSLNFTYLPTH